LSVLTGLHQVSDGDATVGGYSVRDEMDAIREIIGVCPQHDILWPDLTAVRSIFHAYQLNLPVRRPA